MKGAPGSSRNSEKVLDLELRFCNMLSIRSKHVKAKTDEGKETVQHPRAVSSHRNLGLPNATAVYIWLCIHANNFKQLSH